MIGGPYQVDEALLPGDPADEDHRGSVELHAELGTTSVATIGGELVGVDAVLDHVHLRRIEVRVGLQDVALHAGADRDHRVRALERHPLRPGRQPVATAELLGLPRTVRLQRVRGDHVRDVLQQAGEVTGQVGVPGVGVHEVHRRRRRRHGQIGAEDPQGGVRARRVVLQVRGSSVAGLAHALHVDVDQRRELGDELGHVHARPAVDRGRVLPGEETDLEPITDGGHDTHRCRSARLLGKRLGVHSAGHAGVTMR